MKGQEFVDKLDEFLQSILDEGFWQFDYTAEDDAIVFKNFVAWGFDEDNEEEEDEDA
jgi:hypothetical protein|tara:strand:- start:68 stop:238 length:171 start_codon:yes stop_codon:yes gene_type:complete